MGGSSNKNVQHRDRPVSWEWARSIFGNADPPAKVWEAQFDDFQDELRQLAATPYQEIDPSDLWYYFHDLAYVELQPEKHSGGGPYLWSDDSCIYDRGWHEDNLRFLRKTLTLDFVNERMGAAVDRLSGEPESEIARQMLSDLLDRQELIQERVRELPELLSSTKTNTGWTV